MNSLRRSLLLSLLPFTLAALELSPSREEPALETAWRFARAHEYLEQRVEAGRYHGVVAVLEQKGERVFESALGQRDAAAGKAMTLDTIFRIYSMTKPVTAVAALILVDEGKLELDAPLARYLPEFETVQVGVERKNAAGEAVLERVPAERAILVRDLFCHTSGMTYGFLDDSLADQALMEAGIFSDEQTSAEFASKMARAPLKHQPGAKFEYSFSMDVLGRVVEVVSEKSLGDFMRERIFEPLGMQDTGFEVREEERDRVAECYRRVNGKLEVDSTAIDPAVKPRMHWGGAGLYSTADDFLILCRMLLRGGALDETRILQEATVQEMFTDQLAGTPAPMLFFTGSQFGLGLALTGESSRGVHPGTGWWGGYAGTGFWIDPTADLIGVFMIQNMSEIMHTNAFQTQVYRELGR